MKSCKKSSHKSSTSTPGVMRGGEGAYTGCGCGHRFLATRECNVAEKVGRERAGGADEARV